MAFKLVSDLKDSIAGLLSGLDLTNVDNLDGALERAARVFLQKADIPEASGIQNITLYSGVFDYAINPQIFGTSIVDIRPQGISRLSNNVTTKLDQSDFDRTKSYYYNSGTQATFEYRNGVPIIRILAPFPQQNVILDTMSATTGWVASGNASGLVQDSTVYYQQPASLRFTLTGTSTGALTKTISTINLASYQGVGVAFLAIEMPANATASDLTSIGLKIGSDASDYNEVVATQGFLGAWQAGDWLLVAFDFSTATTTGTPNWSAINYLQVVLNTSGTITNFRVGGLWMSFPTPAQILYQTAAIFLPSGSTTPLQTITADTDQILLTDPAYTIYEYEGATAICQQTGGTAGSAMIQQFNSILNSSYTRTGKILTQGLYDQYRSDNPSEVIRKSGSWYDNSQAGNQGYRRY